MTFLRILLELLFPSRCAGCSVAGTAWCPRCASSMGRLFAVHRSALGGGPPAYAVGAYAGSARRLMLAYKERHRRELAVPIGDLMAAAVPRVLARTRAGPGCWLVPAPSRAAELRKRGGNHMELVAARAASTLRARGLPATVAPVLRLRMGVRDSVGLSARARAGNLRGRVRVRGCVPPPGDRVLLLDDVITTGATAAACVTALAAAGVPVTATLALTATV